MKLLHRDWLTSLSGVLDASSEHHEASTFLAGTRVHDIVLAANAERMLVVANLARSHYLYHQQYHNCLKQSVYKHLFQCEFETETRCLWVLLRNRQKKIRRMREAQVSKLDADRCGAHCGSLGQPLRFIALRSLLCLFRYV